LLLLPKANRRLQAWLIVLPAALVLVVWPMPMQLLGLTPADEEKIGFLIVSLVMGWCVVWLLGHCLSVRSRLFTFLLVVMVMVAATTFSCLCYFEDMEGLVPLLVYSAVSILLLSMSMMLAGFCCRHRSSRKQFLVWLAVWVGGGALGLVSVGFLCIVASGNTASAVRYLAAVGSASASLSVILYLVNLPFVLLAFKSPFYQDRLQRVFHTASTQ